MLDCGVHAAFRDESRRYPDLRSIVETHRVDAVLISHFHLDHCGALPLLHQMLKPQPPLYMTAPTKVMAKLLLLDMIKLGKDPELSETAINETVDRATIAQLAETRTICDGRIEITPFYAGHVLGAVMFHIVHLQTGQSVFYTGDYNTTSDRHLAPAHLPIGACIGRPTVMITESTYANRTRESRLQRENQLLEEIHATVTNGGKVLIPVFAAGRAQELCILLQTFWKIMNLEGKVPIYFTKGLLSTATVCYKLFVSWASPYIKKSTMEGKNMFDFSGFELLQDGDLAQDRPLVVFAPSGILTGGASLDIFPDIASDSKNLILILGYCVRGTLGREVQEGAKEVHVKIAEFQSDVEYPECRSQHIPMDKEL